jgi:hypothetical protein
MKTSRRSFLSVAGTKKGVEEVLAFFSELAKGKLKLTRSRWLYPTIG